MTLFSNFQEDMSIFRRISKINDVSEIDPNIRAQPDDTGFANHIVPNDQDSEPPLLVFGALVKARSGDAAHASVAQTREHQGLRHDDDVWSEDNDDADVTQSLQWSAGH